MANTKVSKSSDLKSASGGETKKAMYDDGGWRPELAKPSRAIPSFLMATSIVAFVAHMVVYFFDSDPATRLAEHQDYYYPQISAFIFGYYCLLIITRWLDSDSHILYEQVWACNCAMLLSAIGMVTNQPLLSGLCCALVAVDQMLWYIDLLGYIFTGFKKFPVGVAGYLAWPTTSFVKKITSFHHLWFLPVMLYTLGWKLPAYSFLASTVVCTTLMICGRLFTPFHCLLPLQPGQKEHNVLYLNINAGYAFWKDIKVGFIHWFDHKAPYIYIPWVAITGNLGFNFPANLILLGLLKLVEIARS